MIETQFYILDIQDYVQISAEAEALGITIDYYLSEFCIVECD